MKEFKDILRSKRKALELHQKELAEELGITSQTICNLERGAIPTFFTLDTLANFFECSVDELCGRTGHTYTPPKKMMEFKDIISKKIREHNYDLNGFAEKIGVGYSAVWGWVSGKAYPNLKTLCDMSDAFECSIDELMGRKPNKG